MKRFTAKNVCRNYNIFTAHVKDQPVLLHNFIKRKAKLQFPGRDARDAVNEGWR